MAEDAERPDDAPEPSGPEEAAPEEPVAPGEEGRSQPDQPPAQDADAGADEAAGAQAAGDDSAGDAAPAASGEEAAPAAAEEFVEETPRAKPEIPGADLEVDIVPEGIDPLTGEPAVQRFDEDAGGAEHEAAAEEPAAEEEQADARPQAVIDLGAQARYRATGKRKTAVARVILRPGSGRYTVNGRPLEDHFPRPTLQRNIRQPLETVGYDAQMDVVAKLHGGGVSSQAGALRHGISRALIEADPNLRIELKRRGFLTRDPRVKERKKAGLKKARKRPQFSKR
jgi:small subunit ribosomal protein S9